MANKKFNLTFDASLDITKVKNALNNIQNGMAGIELPKNIGTNLEKTFTKINSEIAKFEQQAERGISSTLDLSNLTKSGRKILDLYQDLQVSMRQLSNLGDKELEKLFPPEITNNIEKARNAFKQYENEIVKNEKAITAQRAELEKSGKTIEKIKNSMASTSGKKLVTNEELDNLKKQAKSASDEVGQLQGELDKLREAKIEKEGALAQPNKSSSYRSLLTEIAEVENKLTIARQKSIDLNNQLGNTTTHQKQQTELNKLSIQLEEAENSFKQTEEAIESIQGAGNNQALVSLFETLKQIPGIDLSQFETSAEGAAQAINYLVQQGLLNARNNVINFTNSLDNANPEIEEFKHNVNSGERALTDFISREQELEDFRRKLLNFFSIDNAVQLFKRALSSAYESVKELDEVMTQTAVVTDFTVGDMWSQLPEYTQRANELGVSVKGAYEAATLYYQQGLATNEVVAVSAETLKMARIAGMDYAQATDYMTAALRGFNMEINEGSAHRVNDVYSELAAITASDTQEIATAMTKTASIANNANMEFETTAAFLSQIIETTRESAETAGTAMKTVIARFQELKKDPSLIGEVDGEMVDANKIETALRTIGVSLRDTNGQFRDLDDVFLEIASKWDSLDTNTQRYIATMAAGSRQQSRFIAMMSNYDRTMELVTAANNSAGASQEQFEKTLESLESKLAKLQNAWNEFTMGITNSTVIKTGIDILTAFLEVINNLTGAFGDTGSAFTKLLLGFGAIKGGKALLGGSFSNILKGVLTGNFEDIGKQIGDKAGQGILSGIKGKLTQTKILAKQEGSNIIKGFTSKFDELSTYNFDLPLSEAISKISLDSLNVEGLKENLFKAIQDSKLSDNKKQSLLNIGAIIEAPEDLQEYVKNLENAGIKTQGISQQMVTDWKAVGGAIAGAGLVVSAIGQALKKMGLEEAGETVTKIGTGITILGTLLSVALPLAAAKGGAAVTAAFLPVTAALAAVIALGVILEQVIKTSEERLEELNKKAEEAAEAAKAAQEAYDNLLSSRTAYDETSQKLDELIEGTQAWRDALIEANNEVLNLLTQYKELEATFDDSGRLVISDESWERAISTRLTQVQNSQLLSTGAQIRRNNEQVAQAKNSLEITGSQYLLDYVKNNREQLEKNPENNEAIQSILNQLRETEQEAAQFNKESQNLLSSSILAAANEQTLDNEYANKIAQTFVSKQTDSFNQAYDEAVKNLKEKDKSELQDYYYELTGQTANSEWSAKELRDKIGTLEAMQGFVEQFDNLVAMVDGLKGSNLSVAEAYLTDGATLRRDDSNSTVEISEDIISALAKALGEDDSIVQERVEKMLEGNAERFMESRNYASRWTSEDASKAANDNLGNATYEQYSGYMNRLAELGMAAMADGGQKGAEQAAGFFNIAMANTLAKSKDKDQVLELISTSDFTTISGIEAFYEALEAIGVHIPFKEQKDFIFQLKTLGATVNDIDLSTLINQVKSLRDLADSLRDRELSEGITQDEYDQIKESGAVDMDKNFWWSGQEYTYLGDSFNTLADALDENTRNQLEEKVIQLEEDINRGKSFSETTEQKGYSDEDLANIAERIRAREQAPEISRLGYSTDTEGQAKFLSDYGNYLQLPQLQSQYDTESTRARQMALSDAQTSEEFTQTTLEGNYTKEEQEGALQSKINSEDLQSEVERITDSLKEQNSELSKNKSLITFLASTNKKVADSFKNLNGKISDNSDVLKNSSKGIKAYDDALYEIAQSASEAFGTEITKEFVEEYKEYFLDLEKGGEVAQSAFEFINEQLLNQLIPTLNLTESKTEELNNILNNLPDPDITGTADFSDVFNELMSLDGMTEETAKKLLELKGFNVELEPAGYINIGPTTGNEYVTKNAPITGWESFPIYSAIATSRDSSGNDGYTPPPGGGGGNTAENDYDKQYNLSQDITSSMREREELERRYNKLIENRAATGKELQEISKQELENLKNQKQLQEQMLRLRKQERQDILNENSQYSEYAKYNEKDNTIEINWEAIDELAKKDADKYEEVSDFIGELEEVQDKIQDAEDALWDIEDAVSEIEARGKDSYIDLETRVVDALIEEQNKVIEEQEKINESINDAASDLMDAIQSSINKLRQDRENEKTEDSLSEKERRLAYLRQDTSGANAMEIRKLEEELANEREAYGDTLIDQALQDLQEQNDDAAEQRERQIKLLQDQLEWAEKTGAYNARAKEILEKGILNGTLNTSSELYKLLHAAENAGAMTEVSYLEWLKDLRLTVAEAYQYQETIKEEDNTDYMALMQERFASNGGDIDSDILEWNRKRNEKIDRNPELGMYGRYDSKEELEKFLKANTLKTETTTAPPAVTTWTPAVGEIVKVQSGAKFTNGSTMAESVRKNGVISNYPGGFKILSNLGNDNYLIGISSKAGQVTGAINKKYLTKYKTGGLADFTGPAWLDGTKSRPEMVLNAQDTENFLVLKDILSSLLHLPTVENTSGDNYFDISIQVDEISDDYDVDQMVERVKQKIYEDSMYRNNNSINLLR